MELSIKGEKTFLTRAQLYPLLKDNSTFQLSMVKQHAFMHFRMDVFQDDRLLARLESVDVDEILDSCLIFDTATRGRMIQTAPTIIER